VTIRPARADERTYIRETALKLIQPSGSGFRAWEKQATPWISGLHAVVLADGDVLVVGFALEGPAGVQLLYVRRKFRGVGFGRELMQGRRRDPVAVGFGAWSDWEDPDTSLRSAQTGSERDATNVSVSATTKNGGNRP
jgi:GNAT superfamily N-acetyltransferase